LAAAFFAFFRGAFGFALALAFPFARAAICCLAAASDCRAGGMGGYLAARSMRSSRPVSGSGAGSAGAAGWRWRSSLLLLLLPLLELTLLLETLLLLAELLLATCDASGCWPPPIMPRAAGDRGHLCGRVTAREGAAAARAAAA
jgi:hypothetical protein